MICDDDDDDEDCGHQDPHYSDDDDDDVDDGRNRLAGVEIWGFPCFLINMME